MSLISKIKNKFLNSSDSYNHYKNESNRLSKDIDKELKDLRREFDRYKKTNDSIQKSYNRLFNTIFLDYDLKPKGALKYTQILCLELLDFYINVCKKYDLEFWLDYGNLLGARRHNGFIPWDDDLDVGMMREDCQKFNEVFEKEVKLHNLENIIDISREFLTSETSVRAFTQITIRNNYDYLYAGLDVFPCDYVIDPPEDIEEVYKSAKVEYYKNTFHKMDKEDVIKDFYERVNCSYDKQKYYLPSIEGPFGNGRYKFNLFKTDKLFPLKEIEFEGRFYPCPNDVDDYLTGIYGEHFMKIPRLVHYHRRLDTLRKDKDLEDKFNYYLKTLKEANDNFKM